MRCYIYEHIRLDTNEVFYIGRGTVSKRASGKVDTSTYRRAYVKHTANKYWMHITSSTPYQVKITHDYLSWDESVELEKLYIAKYGRGDLKKGTLVNFTDGGEGSFGAVTTERAKEVQRVRMSGPDNPAKQLYNRAKYSLRMKQDNPMWDPNTTKKVSEANKASWESGAHSHPRKGKPREDLRQRNLTNNPAKTPEARKKISEARKARDYRGGNSPSARAVIDPSTNITYPTVSECALALGKSKPTIFKYLKQGKIKYA